MEAKSVVDVQFVSSTEGANESDWHKFYYKLSNGVTLLYTLDKQGEYCGVITYPLEFIEGKYSQTFRNVIPKILIGPEQG